MTKLYSLFGGTTTDTDVKAVEVNQVIQMEGYACDRYVVHKITHNEYGYHYHLINLRTLDMQQSEIIKPLSQKFGIGMYYDENNIEFKTNEEVAELYAKAQKKKVNRIEKEREEEKQREAIRVIGRQWLKDNLPEDAQALIVAKLKQDKSDSQTDYFASSTTRTVILGFSKHKRDLFSEMRKYAANFEGTAYLAEFNADYEHREKYSMGAGYYLGESKYHGWIIEKESIYNREQLIERFAYTAGCPNGIYIKTKSNQTKCIANSQVQEQQQEETEQITQLPTQTIVSDNLSFEIVDYSEKAIALFGDTKAIKDLLKAMGGKFNPRLAYKADKRAGWIFQTSKREELETVLKTKSKITMKATTHFKNTIQNYLEQRAQTDALFEWTYTTKEYKNIDDCCTYILNEVQKSGCNGFADDEIFGMAVHYYDYPNLYKNLTFLINQLTINLININR